MSGVGSLVDLDQQIISADATKNKQNGYNNFTTLLYFSYSNHFVYFSSPLPLGSVCHLRFAFRTLPGVGCIIDPDITIFSTSASLGTKGFADCNQRRFRFSQTS